MEPPVFSFATGKAHEPQEQPRPYPPASSREKPGITILQRRFPIHAPIATANERGTRIEKETGWAMTEKEERLARERAEIAARVASFRETQQKFEREREEYYATTLGSAWSGFGRPSFLDLM
jgi:hypothetical protein